MIEELIKNMPIQNTDKIGDRLTINYKRKQIKLIVGTDIQGKLKWIELGNLAYN